MLFQCVLSLLFHSCHYVIYSCPNSKTRRVHNSCIKFAVSFTPPLFRSLLRRTPGNFWISEQILACSTRVFGLPCGKTKPHDRAGCWNTTSDRQTDRQTDGQSRPYVLRHLAEQRAWEFSVRKGNNVVKQTFHIWSYGFFITGQNCIDYCCMFKLIFSFVIINPLTPTVAIWVQLKSILCQTQTGLSRHL